MTRRGDRPRRRRRLLWWDARPAGLALAAALLPWAAGAQPPAGAPRVGIRAATPEEVAKRLREEEDAIKAEPPVAGLSRAASYYLRTRLPNLVPLTRDDTSPENFRFATAELRQPSPFTCVGDFDGDGLEDVALVARDRTTQRIRLLALHQVTVNWNVGGLTSKSYNTHPIVESGGPVAPGTKLDELLVVCEKPGHFESVEGGVTLLLRHHSIRYGFSLYYFLGGRYRELTIGD